MSVIDFQAVQKWARFPKDIQELLINNVYCSSCGVTTITKYTLHDDKWGVLLKGKCKKCGNDVARLVEDESNKGTVRDHRKSPLFSEHQYSHKKTGL